MCFIVKYRFSIFILAFFAIFIYTMERKEGNGITKSQVSFAWLPLRLQNNRHDSTKKSIPY